MQTNATPDLQDSGTTDGREERTDLETRSPTLTPEVARATANGADGDVLPWPVYSEAVASAEATIRRLAAGESEAI